MKFGFLGMFILTLYTKRFTILLLSQHIHNTVTAHSKTILVKSINYYFQFVLQKCFANLQSTIVQ